ncbi:MAG: phosphoribosylanthranilate isomerase [Weeksellaceae bacterium]
MKLKVCGITDFNQAKSLAQMSVDFIGFIGYEKSPRYAWNKISPAEVATLKNVLKVGVFVNEKVDKVLELAHQAELDYIQLHGDEPLEVVKEIAKDFKVIKAISISNDLEDLQSKINSMQNEVSYFLFDTATPNYGGSGQKFDWHILNQLNISKPFFLSGGIGLESRIDSSTFKTAPYALDINSRFEVEPGVKDLIMIKDFILKNNI